MTMLIPAMRTLKVLVVDDEPRLRELLVDSIEDMGFEASAARTAEEAIRRLQSEPHDIAMLDLHLPGMAGMDLFTHIREKHPAMAVIVLTGFGDLESARKAIALDVVDFLTKPCHMSEIERALDRARKRLLPGGAALPLKPALSPPPPEVETVETSTLADAERIQILAALSRHGGNRTAAAAALGISRRTLQYRLREYRRQGLL